MRAWLIALLIWIVLFLLGVYELVRITPPALNWPDMNALFANVVFALLFGVAAVAGLLFAVIPLSIRAYMLNHRDLARILAGDLIPLLLIPGVAYGVNLYISSSFASVRSSIESPAPRESILQSVSMVSPQEGWAVGGTLINPVAILHYKEGIWTEVPSPTDEPLWSVFMVSANDGWAVGSGTTILHCDHGLWVKANSPDGVRTDIDLQSVYMTSANDGWAVGGDLGNVGGTILHYTGGKWLGVQSPTDQQLNSVFMVSADEGWAVGANGTILHYSGGKWSNVESSTNALLTGAWLTGISMVSADEGWAVGGVGGGLILHYQHGKWTLVPNDFLIGLESVSMVSADEGWAVGTDLQTSVILHYKDGKWGKELSLSGVTLRAMKMISSQEGWTVGDNKVIWHYLNGTWSEYRSKPN